MGQKVNPIGLRLNVIRGWESTWYAKKDYSKYLLEDHEIRKFLKSRLFHAGVSRINIARTGDKIRIKLHTARPGIVIGKKGAEIESLKQELDKRTKRSCILDIQEIRKPEADAQLVAENVAMQLVRRIAFRRAMKKAVNMALKFGAKGIKICCSGRLGGAEMSRVEWYREGRVPLHTLRADVEYGFSEAKTTYGIIGVKVWIFKGEIIGQQEQEQ